MWPETRSHGNYLLTFPPEVTSCKTSGYTIRAILVVLLASGFAFHWCLIASITAQFHHPAWTTRVEGPSLDCPFSGSRTEQHPVVTLQDYSIWFLPLTDACFYTYLWVFMYWFFAELFKLLHYWGSVLRLSLCPPSCFYWQIGCLPFGSHW